MIEHSYSNDFKRFLQITMEKARVAYVADALGGLGFMDGNADGILEYVHPRR